MATAADQAAVALIASTLVDQVTQARVEVTGRAADGVAAIWAGVATWYGTAAIAEPAGAAADLSVAAQQLVHGFAAEYAAQVAAVTKETARVEVPRTFAPSIRGGIPLARVHARPAETYRDTYAFTLDEDLARARAVARAVRLVEDDLMLTRTLTERQVMERLGITAYRRVLRPELSESGPCGLCVVASDRRYRIRDPLPLHGRCCCETLPVVGDVDPGRPLNEEDLARIYDAAESTAAEDLKRTRVAVRKHGELGPVLVVRKQKFTGPDDLTAQTADARRNTEQALATLQANLATLMDRSSSGEDLDGPLAYQRARIARFERTA